MRHFAKRARLFSKLIDRLLASQRELRASQARLLEQQSQLDITLDNMTQGICIFGADRRLVCCNQRYADMYGFPVELMKPGTPHDEIVAFRTKSGVFADEADARPTYNTDAARGESVVNQTKCRIKKLADGRLIKVTRQPAHGGWVAIHEDVSEQREAEVELDDTRKFLDSIIANIPIAVVVKDALTLKFVLTNRAFEDALGLSGMKLAGKSAFDLFGNDDARGMEAADSECLRSSVGVLTREFNVNNPRLGPRILLAKRIVIHDQNGTAKYLLVVIEDVTQQRNAERRIEFMAHHDPLTGLANRATITRKLEELTHVTGSHEVSFTLFLLDLDRFKQVNDTLGHSAGDVLLREMSTRLSSALRNGDFLARLGGDEFAVIQVGVANPHRDAKKLADRIMGLVGKPFEIDGQAIDIGVSIGAAMAPEHATDPDDLMRMADLALYQSKSEGRNCFRAFNPELGAAAGARHKLEHELRDAIQNREFELYYQPVVDASSAKTRGVEALIRWRHPERGLINPDQFIPLAEETGLINQIGEWVLHTACDEAAKWPSDVKVAVNLSPVQLRMATLPDIVTRALAQSGLAAERLELEITETALIESPDECLPALRKFKEKGIAIALDDFGTGYSSLAQLTMFPFDKIKIDKSFTQNMTRRADCAAIITATLALARALDIETTAEGVETADQYRLLRLAGVRSLQGYLFSRPVAPDRLNFDAVFCSSEIEEVA